MHCSGVCRDRCSWRLVNLHFVQKLHPDRLHCEAHIAQEFCLQQPDGSTNSGFKIGKERVKVLVARRKKALSRESNPLGPPRCLSRSSHPNKQHPQGGITGDQNPTSHGDRAAGHNVLCRHTLPPRPKSDILCVARWGLALDRPQYPSCLSAPIGLLVRTDLPVTLRGTESRTVRRWDKIESPKLCRAAPCHTPDSTHAGSRPGRYHTPLSWLCCPRQTLG
jgi:hypothetical protein